jgi:putative radical SAM enzyme (TIGR03279 family)
VLRVAAVAPDSIGAELGLLPGTELLSVNARRLEDFLDWEFLTADETFVLRARLPSGDELEYDIERPEGMPLGVALEPPRIRRCANHCDFCFVDGNPAGMRQSLYIRDDDYRLSFRYGNFATLTNLKAWDEARIVEYRLSPLYVSVHATDPLVRRWLLRNPEAPDIVAQLSGFAEQGIRFHTQVVLVPGVNDGPVLERTLGDLFGIGAGVLSVSVVPVALTEYSKHNLVQAPSTGQCRVALDSVDRWSARAVAERGHPWCFGADDLYLQAGVALPPAAWYGDFEQRENGVGAVRYLQTRIAAATRRFGDWRGKRIAIATGTAMAPLMPQVIEQLTSETGAAFEVLPFENHLFGAAVTTAGLLPGAAFLDGLRDRRDFHLALLPAESVNDDLRFMDDLDAHSLAAQLPMEIRFSHDFADVLADGWADGRMGGWDGGSAGIPSADPTIRPSLGEER